MFPRLIDGNGGRIEAPMLFFSKLGDLHDAKILLFEWNPIRGEIAFAIDDLYANFEGLPEYEGAQSVRLVLNGVSDFEVNAISDRFPMRIMGFEVEEDPAESKLRVLVNMATGFIRVGCGSIDGFGV